MTMPKFSVDKNGNVDEVRLNPSTGMALRLDNTLAGWFKPLFVGDSEKSAREFQEERESHCMNL
jgi:hypothetical protein